MGHTVCAPHQLRTLLLRMYVPNENVLDDTFVSSSLRRNPIGAYIPQNTNPMTFLNFQCMSFNLEKLAGDQVPAFDKAASNECCL